jgi:hypothetical protein
MLLFVMKKKIFYMLTNKIHEMSYQVYLNHLKNEVLNQIWFKKACKEKKIKIIYLNRNFIKNNSKNIYLEILEKKIYFDKFFLLKFYYENLENNNHIKLLNINIRNEALFKVSSFLISTQIEFINTCYYQDLEIIDRNLFIKNYIKKYNSYLDASILSKILNNTEYSLNKKKLKLKYLLPQKTFIYSLYIREIINENPLINSDLLISNIIKTKYKIEISRRQVCYIRSKYLIPKLNKRNDYNFYRFNEKLFNKKEKLEKNNIESLRNNIKGIYELSTNKIEIYPYLKNNIIYIGSSNNIKKRLSTYTEKNAHSERIKDFIKKNDEIYFRIIKTSQYKEYEVLFINAFINMSGDLPKLNKQRIHKIFFK